MIFISFLFHLEFIKRKKSGEKYINVRYLVQAWYTTEIMKKIQ